MHGHVQLVKEVQRALDIMVQYCLARCKRCLDLEKSAIITFIACSSSDFNSESTI